MYRNIEENLINWKTKKGRQPLILKGARQIGKTYTLKSFGQKKFRKLHYINFEEDGGLKKIFDHNLRPERILKDISIALSAQIDISQDLLILDEIQACPKALTALKYFCETIPELAVCAAGSLLGVELNEESFPVGKVDYLYMFPLSFSEFLLGIGANELYSAIQEFSNNQESISAFMHEKLWEYLKIYFITGGMPAVINTYKSNSGEPLTGFAKIREKQEDIINSYYADFTKHAGNVNAMHIERVWSNIPLQLAKELDGSAKKFNFKGVIPGQSRYSRLVGCIDWLEKAGLVIQVPICKKAELPLKAYTDENKFKLYIFDVGILGAIAGLAPETIYNYDYGTYKGYFAENYVAQELTNAEAKTGTLFSWAEGSAEIEFIKDIGGQVFPLEVKSGWVTHSKSLMSFGNKYQVEHKSIMNAKEFHHNLKNNTFYYPLYLAEKWPMLV